MRIGFVTIGQSPRGDLIGAFRSRIGEGHELLQAGALDGLTVSEIETLAPAAQEEPLFTRLQWGQSVTIAKERIIDLMQARIDELRTAGVEMVVILCTGPFPELEADVPLLVPDVILRQFVKGVMPHGNLGVIAPLEEQYPMMRDKWPEYEPLAFDVLDPYNDQTPFRDLGRFDDSSLIVLDCMGYSLSAKHALRDNIGKPVLLAQEVLAHTVELLAGH